jgi:hypothetical protein
MDFFKRTGRPSGRSAIANRHKGPRCQSNAVPLPARFLKTTQLGLALFSPPATGGCERRSPDRPDLAVASNAGPDRRLRRRAPSVEFACAEVEALPGAEISYAAGTENPLLCGTPVAPEQLDGRSISRSASVNVETLPVRCGRSDALDLKPYESPLLGKGPFAWKGDDRRPVGRAGETHGDACSRNVCCSRPCGRI